ncbi:MAG: penicillin-binding protein 2, partial [Gemmatimonadetes bacterium]|nr:penicillin-binding protein 2 [Gemmatimonadota bacterium]NIQ59138.1 penicillin-binding protein 2 [Gemmatimonadota bacterium]NIU79342.1 penicillin-binding protein 2 [Gammaproteobacteria bacterium]NIX48010.1 penicillin-binding protein 2 [Gemmatimonadota bacterium]NIY07390.1 penicillin-binding protein 2 [Gemmatimonadota bacterium]
NRLRPLTLLAPRGTIVDREGRIVADNVPGYALSLLPAPRDSIRSTLERLAPYLELTDRQVEQLMERRRSRPQQQLVVSTDLSFDRISAIEERRPMFPEVLIEMRPKRNYPAGPAAAHLIGYVGEISERELEDTAFAEYRAGQVIGKTGVERQYERRLSGDPGVRYVEVDALGRIIGDFPGHGELDPVPGHSLQLTIDLDLQRWLHRIVPDTARGAIVALDPRDGSVLGLYSSPTFDPNGLVGVVPPERWDSLRQDTAKRLLDRAIAGLYPPGSTWKLATAAIALELGIVDPQQTLPLACRGGMRYGNRYFRCWEPAGHGYLTLPDAIKHSCDVYFYQVGLQIGLERLLAEGIRLGFAERTGIDLPEERSGFFPPETDWYERRFGWAPTEAEVLSLAIGQGANDQTALKMAQFYVALAGDGRAPPPRVAVDRPTAAGMDLRVAPENLEWLREGLRRVTRPGGTAAGSAIEHWVWSGKTGTSQNPHGPDHGWFVGIAGPPDGEPEVVVAAIIEAGEHGSDVAQLAAKAADYYLRKQRGMPIDTIQTLREHWQAGQPAPWVQWD